MRRCNLVHVSPGVALPADGTPCYIESRDGMRHVFRRANAATWSGDPDVRVDLLPATAFAASSGEPLADGHRVFLVRDTSGDAPARWYLVEVIEPYSNDRGWPTSPEHLIAACETSGIDPAPALICSTALRQIYSVYRLRDLLRDHARASRAALAAEAAIEGQPAEVIEAIAEGWPDGKTGVTEADGLNILPPGALAWCYGWIEAVAA